MKLNSIIQKIGERAPFIAKKSEAIAPPTLDEAVRFPYGPFQFKTLIRKGTPYMIQACTDLQSWHVIAQDVAAADKVEYLDSDASKFSYRFYQLLAGEIQSANIIGYASVTLPPGLSMIA